MPKISLRHRCLGAKRAVLLCGTARLANQYGPFQTAKRHITQTTAARAESQGHDGIDKNHTFSSTEATSTASLTMQGMVQANTRQSPNCRQVAKQIGAIGKQIDLGHWQRPTGPS